MNSMINIKENTAKNIDSNIHDFLNPDYIYIPLKENDVINVKNNTEIFKNHVLIKNNDKYVYSPVSGKVIGKTETMFVNNKKIESLILENDFREHVSKKTPATKYINEYSKEELIDILNKYSNIDINKIINNRVLLVSGVDIDPYEKNYSFVINYNSEAILETIDALSSILKYEKTFLAVSNKDSNNVINLTNHIGTYPNIKLKLVPDVYPISFPSLLMKNTLKKSEIDLGVTFLNVNDIINIYNVLKRRQASLEKYITISGSALEQPIVVNVKLGTLMADLIKNKCNIIDPNYYVVVNGLISGTTLGSLNTIITDDIRSIFLTKKDNTSEKQCINCGLCNTKCPVGLNPKYIREHKKADRSKCIGCGLCTYICPAKINFKNSLGGKNEE